MLLDVVNDVDGVVLAIGIGDEIDGRGGDNVSLLLLLLFSAEKLVEGERGITGADEEDIIFLEVTRVRGETAEVG